MKLSFPNETASFRVQQKWCDMLVYIWYAPHADISYTQAFTYAWQMLQEFGKHYKLFTLSVSARKKQSLAGLDKHFKLDSPNPKKLGQFGKCSIFYIYSDFISQYKPKYLMFCIVNFFILLKYIYSCISRQQHIPKK